MCVCVCVRGWWSWSDGPRAHPGIGPEGDTFRPQVHHFQALFPIPVQTHPRGPTPRLQDKQPRGAPLLHQTRGCRKDPAPREANYSRTPPGNPANSAVKWCTGGMGLGRCVCVCACCVSLCCLKELTCVRRRVWVCVCASECSKCINSSVCVCACVCV